MNGAKTLFNLKNNIEFHKKRWRKIHIHPSTIQPPFQKFDKLFEEEIDEIKYNSNMFGFIFELLPVQTNKADFLGITKFQQIQRFFDQQVFNFKYFLEAVHPDYFQIYLWNAIAAYITAWDPKIVKQMVPKYKEAVRVSFPLLRTSLKSITSPNKEPEDYYWVNQESIAFQVTQGRLISHFNTYKWEHQFRKAKEDAHYTFYDWRNQEFSKELDLLWRKNRAEAFWQTCDPIDKAIIESYWKEPDLTAAQLAEIFAADEKVSINTVGALHNRQSRLKEKMGHPYPLYPGFQSESLSGYLKKLREDIGPTK